MSPPAWLAALSPRPAPPRTHQTLYYLLQSCVLVALLVGWLQLVTFQRRLAVIPAALRRAVPDLLHLLLVVLCVSLMLAGLMVVVFGHRVSRLASYALSATFVMQYIMLATDQGLFPVRAERGGMERERAGSGLHRGLVTAPKREGAAGRRRQLPAPSSPIPSWLRLAPCLQHAPPHACCRRRLVVRMRSCQPPNPPALAPFPPSRPPRRSCWPRESSSRCQSLCWPTCCTSWARYS